MVDKTSTPPAVKRVRWDDSVTDGAEQPARAMDGSSNEAANPVSAEPSCNANDAIRLHDGENHRTLKCAVCSRWVRFQHWLAIPDTARKRRCVQYGTQCSGTLFVLLRRYQSQHEI